MRLKQNYGEIFGPYFLNRLEKAGFSKAVNWWVIDHVESILNDWESKNFKPNVHINLNPAALSDPLFIDKLIKHLSPFKNQIEIEILETAFIKNFVKIR